MVAERLAVFLHGARNHMSVDEKVLLLNRLGLGDLAVRVDILCSLESAIGVVLADLVELPLVGLNLVHELTDVGQGRTGRLLSQA